MGRPSDVLYEIDTGNKFENRGQPIGWVPDNIPSAPGHGQVIVSSTDRSRSFNFAANGSDERQKFFDLFQYCADELASGKKVYSMMGVGHFGFDGNGIAPVFANGSDGFTLQGSGKSVTTLGYVGNTESGSTWHILKISPENDAVKDIVSMTQVAGVATVNIVGHNATANTLVRIYNSIDDEYNGVKMVTGITDADNFTFNIETTAPATATKRTDIGADPMTCAIHNDFLKNFQLSNFSMLDTNPVAHQGVSTEETHGIGTEYILGLDIHNVESSGIGDESFELQWCEDFDLRNLRSNETPSVQIAGGGVLSIKCGCHHGVVDHLSSYNMTRYQPVQLGYGVNFKMVVHREECSHISLSNANIVNPATTGIRFNTSSADIKNIEIDNLIAIGGATAIETGGSGFILSDIKLNRITGLNQSDSGINLARTALDAKDITVSNSVIDGQFMPDASSAACMIVNGDGINLVNNIYKNVRQGVIGGAQVRNLKVIGGKMINIGDATTGATTFNQYVYDQDTTKSGIVDGLTIVDGKCKTVGFRDLKTIKNINFVGTTTQPANWIGQGIGNFENNKNVPHNVQISDDGGRCTSNEFTHTASGGNGCIRLNNINGAIVTGNSSPNLTSGNGIVEASGSDSNIITGNNMNGRPINVVGASTIQTGGNL